MTDLVRTPALTPVDPRTRALSVIAVGAIGGCVLGVAARAWMRLISEDPEFTWRGTISIVAGFTIFGFAQSLVAVARQRVSRRWKLTVIRTLGVIAMLPLFVAAGSLMFPTVIGGGLAVARTGWHTLARTLCLLMSGAGSMRRIHVPGPRGGIDIDDGTPATGSTRDSSRRLLLDSKRPMMGNATTFAACKTPMINKMPPMRAISCCSCSPVEPFQLLGSTKVTVNNTNDAKIK